MTRLVGKLTDSGYKVTPQRRIILDILNKSPRHLTAEEVADEVKKIQPSVSVATIYRNLNLMVDIMLLSKLDLHNGPARYQINQGHNHHMVCLECGEAIKLGVCPMQGEIARMVQETGFKVDHHHFEITGICKECQVEKQEKK